MLIARRPFVLGLSAALTAPSLRARAAGAELVVSQFTETRDLAAIDPFRSLDFTIPNSLVFDRLMDRDAEGTLVPGLATAWDRVTPTTWRLAIRRGVRFHDGTPLTAADVAATLAFALDPANRSGLRAQLQPLVRAEAPDAGTLLLETAGPTALLPDIVAAVPTLPAAQLAAPGAPFRTQPIGSGPWRLAEWRQGERLGFEATGQHWRFAAPGFTRITVRVVPEASTRVADLLSGGAGIASDIPPALAARVGRGGTRLVTQAGARTNYLSFWFRPPFDDARVRRAVHHAIDRRAYAETISGGELAEPATAPYPARWAATSRRSPSRTTTRPAPARCCRRPGWRCPWPWSWTPRRPSWWRRRCSNPSSTRPGSRCGSTRSSLPPRCSTHNAWPGPSAGGCG